MYQDKTLVCKDCGKEVISPKTIKHIANLFREHGPNVWYEWDEKDLMPEGFKCECGCTEFKKETDIMDVWFDSGSTHESVLAERGFFDAELLKNLRQPGCILQGHPDMKTMKGIDMSAGSAAEANEPEFKRGYEVDATPDANLDLCVFCGICAKACPQDAVSVDRENKTWVVDEDKCIHCAICAYKCPKKCIDMK